MWRMFFFRWNNRYRNSLLKWLSRRNKNPCFFIRPVWRVGFYISVRGPLSVWEWWCEGRAGSKSGKCSSCPHSAPFSAFPVNSYPSKKYKNSPDSHCLFRSIFRVENVSSSITWISVYKAMKGRYCPGNWRGAWILGENVHLGWGDLHTFF